MTESQINAKIAQYNNTPVGYYDNGLTFADFIAYAMLVNVALTMILLAGIIAIAVRLAL